MFLRSNRRRRNGELYEYWTLVKSVRTARGPRQRIVATLEMLAGLDEEERGGVRLRLVGKPERLTAELMARMKLRLPNRPKVIQNVVEKN